MMRKTIKKQLIQYFLACTLMLCLIFLLATGIIVRYTFNQYKSDTIEENNLKLVKYIESNYSLEKDCEGNLARDLMMLIQQRGLDIIIYDQNKKILWSQNYMMEHINHINRGDLITSEYPLVRNGSIIGYLSIQQSDSSVLTEEDSLFLKNLLIGVILSSIFGLLIASSIALKMSQNLSRPIIRIKNVAEEIERGNLSLRITEKNSLEELESLATSINDMTETLERQKNLRTTLANNISHELRNPLYIMKTHVEALSDGILSPTKQTFESINAEINHLTLIVADLEQLNTIEETINLEKSNESMTNFFNDFLLSYEGIIKSEQKSITFNTEDHFILNCDLKRLRQVFTNLMSNALKFTNDGDAITIDLKEEQGYLVINFTDNGVGIPKDVLPYIFERFYKVSYKKDKQSSGAGLGLAIAKEIILQHNGSIHVDSVQGKYTTFEILLPLSS